MSRILILAAWSIVALLVVGCEIASVVSRRRLAGLQELLDRLSRGNAAFVALFIGWMWVGWHFFAR